MWVVKLGGSLDRAGYLRDWTHALAEAGSPLIIVPGGGEFANAVRAAQGRWDLDDAAAHRMAILAMEQTAHLLCGICPELIPVAGIASPEASPAHPYTPVASRFENTGARKDSCSPLALSPKGRGRKGAPSAPASGLKGRQARVWFPAADLLDDKGIPPGWDITSDSLAAILAHRIGAKGLVLIKSAPLEGASSDIDSLQANGILDAAFDRYGAACGCPLWLLRANRSEGLKAILEGRGGPAGFRITRRGDTGAGSSRI